MRGAHSHAQGRDTAMRSSRSSGRAAAGMAQWRLLGGLPGGPPSGWAGQGRQSVLFAVGGRRVGCHQSGAAGPAAVCASSPGAGSGPHFDRAIDRGRKQALALRVHGQAAHHISVRLEALHQLRVHQLPVEDPAVLCRRRRSQPPKHVRAAHRSMRRAGTNGNRAAACAVRAAGA